MHFRTCPDFKEFECSYSGCVQRKDGEDFTPFLVSSRNKPSRKYRSLNDHWTGHIHRQVFKAWGPANPDPTRYNLVDHIDNNPQNDHCDNLRWSNKPLNALNVDPDQFKGWSLDASRTRPYKAHMKWMGRTTTLGRFGTAKEAKKAYLDCKAFIQVKFREHICEDILLVFAWRKSLNRDLGKQRGRSESAIRVQMAKLRLKGLIE